MDYQIHFEKKFYKDHKSNYWISTTCPKIRAHRWVWQSVHGNIPVGYHIHHINEDKSDNRIENLELIEQSRHLRLYGSQPEQRKRAKEMADKYRPLTKEWHSSEEGRKWHHAHGILTWIDRKPIRIACKQCSKTTSTKSFHQEFCSNACKSKWRRVSGLDDIERICEICDKKFLINRYSKSCCCSRSCAAKFRWNNRKRKSQSWVSYA